MNKLDRLGAMTVADLIEHLSEMPEDAPVVYATDYGDYCHTTQALPVVGVGNVASDNISETAYSNSGYKVDSEYTDEKDTELSDVVVLSMHRDEFYR